MGFGVCFHTFLSPLQLQSIKMRVIIRLALVVLFSSPLSSASHRSPLAPSPTTAVACCCSWLVVSRISSLRCTSACSASYSRCWNVKISSRQMIIVRSFRISTNFCAFPKIFWSSCAMMIKSHKWISPHVFISRRPRRFVRPTRSIAMALSVPIVCWWVENVN